MADTLYIAASVNRTSHSAAISSSSQVLYGSHKFVACWEAADDLDRGLKYTIPGHDSEVTAVKWIVEDLAFCSGDQGGHLLFWTLDTEGKWHVAHRIRAQTRAISALATHGELIVTGSSDGELKVYTYQLSSGHAPSLSQTMSLKGRYPLDIALSTLPGSAALVMAVASTDRNIRIFTRSEDQFVSSLSLDGHEDWVKCLAFANSDAQSGKNELLLASGSQDGYIRLWMISPNVSAPQEASDGPVDDLMDAFEKNLGEMSDEIEEGGKKISNRAHVFSVGDSENGTRQYSLTFDALLIGHEAGVTSLAWQPAPNTLPTLLSTSTDSSLILWSPSDVPVAPSRDASSSAPVTASLWMNRQRFGDVGGTKPGGFVGGHWGRGGKEVLGYGWNGSWRRWRDVSVSPATGGDTPAGLPTEVWKEVPAVFGHAGPVRGLAWEPQGNYLVSTSLDQTTRIHGPWRRPAGTDGSLDLIETWHEISRPQIHGYDLIAATWLDSFRFVSVADEKVARVFDAPKGFVKTLEGLRTAEGSVAEAGSRPAAAVVPPLGLSNKATGENSTETSALVAEEDAEMHRRPPLEPELGALTLWPETEKVFGHGYELLTVASSHDGKMLATACKSTTAEHAVMRLYDTTSWRAIRQPLAGHTLTVTRIAFSPDDQLVLTVSRDRSWRLFQRNNDDDGGFTPLYSDKSHARVIWDCAWASEGDIFATAARDKTVKIWRRSEEVSSKWQCIQTIKLNDAATAVDFTPADANGRRRIAVGTETGQIIVYEASASAADAFQELRVLDQTIACVDQIHRLAWRPSQGVHAAANSCDLAVCSEDRSLRILRIMFP